MHKNALLRTVASQRELLGPPRLEFRKGVFAATMHEGLDVFSVLNMMPPVLGKQRILLAVV
jgi:hypothetical protein